MKLRSFMGRFVSKTVALVMIASIMSSSFLTASAAPIENKQQLLKRVLERDKSGSELTIRKGIVGAFDAIDEGYSIDDIMLVAQESGTYKDMTETMKPVLKNIFLEYKDLNSVRRALVRDAFDIIRVTDSVKNFYDANATAINGFPEIKARINNLLLSDANNNDGMKLFISMLGYLNRHNVNYFTSDADSKINLDIVGYDNIQAAMNTFLGSFYNKSYIGKSNIDDYFTLLEEKVNVGTSTEERQNFINFLKNVKSGFVETEAASSKSPLATPTPTTTPTQRPSSGGSSRGSSGGGSVIYSTPVVEETTNPIPRDFTSAIDAAEAVISAPTVDSNGILEAIKALSQEIEPSQLTTEQSGKLKNVIDLAYDKLRTVKDVNEKSVEDAIANLDVLEANAKDMGVALPSTKTLSIAGNNGEFTLPVESLNKMTEKNIAFEVDFGDIKLTVPVGSLNVPAGTTKLIFTAKELQNSEKEFKLDVAGDNGNVGINAGKNVLASIKKAFENADESDECAIFYVNEADGKDELVSSQSYNKEKGAFEMKMPKFGTYKIVQKEVYFDDISDYTWAQTPIRSLASRGIIVGVEPRKFAPAQTVTRAQFLTMLVKGFGLIDESAESSFEDVNKSAWYYKTVSSAYVKGIVKGKSLYSFDPDSQITRAEMAVMMNNLIKVAGLKCEVVNEEISYLDASAIPDYAKDAVNFITKIGIMQGHPGSRFNPNLKATRAEAAVVVYNLSVAK